MDFYDYSWQAFPDIGRSTGAYIIFYQGGPIEHGTHFPGPVAQSSAESEYNAACTAGMALAIIDLSIVYKSGLVFCSTQVSKTFSEYW